MVEVEIEQSSLYLVYFHLVIDGTIVGSTSARMADILKLDLDTYNKILIEEVIQHSYYKISPSGHVPLSKDIIFELNDESKETYINRFKEAFAKELVFVSFSLWTRNGG